jgi:multiple sugar transport system ATP-binding protein
VAGSQRIALGAETLSARPALESFAGRPLVLGIRPEDLDDASLVEGAPGDRRLKGQVELREALGAEIMVHFSVDASPALTDDVRELAEDVAGAADPAVQPSQEEGGTIMVGRFSPRSRVNEGDSVEVAVDTRALHFFDAETGLAVYDEADRTKGVPA